ncbi:MAG: sugar ABC transporter permease [Treponema sp.]|jgi:raffinose/stachyose/melibiose transport system permease protein|nr:sugar ABC transporter permease [Treponema sp.]
MKKITVANTGYGWLFLLPALVLNAVVMFIPSLFTIFLSFTEWNGLGVPKVIGIDNFVDFFGERNFFIAIKNTLKWLVFFLTVPFIMSLGMAVILLFKKKGRTLFQSIFFLPNIISPVIICSLFTSMIFHPRSGILGFINGRRLLPFTLANPLTDIRTSIWGCMFVDNWHWWGFMTVIFLAAMRQVDENILEAAEIDGAGFMKRFTAVIIPSIKSNIFFMVLMTIIWTFLTFDYIWILTGGGPANSSEMLSTLAYRMSFYTHEIGRGAAASLMMSFLAGIVIVVYVLMQIREETI